MEKRIYRSYQTGEAVTETEARAGLKMLDRANEMFEGFEGWVHCQGSPEQFWDNGDLVLSEEDVIEAVRNELGEEAVDELKGGRK